MDTQKVADIRFDLAAGPDRTVVVVTVDPKKFENLIHQGMHVLRQLQSVGVPVTGVLFPTGVASGTLKIGAPDLVSGEVVYTWESD